MLSIDDKPGISFCREGCQLFPREEILAWEEHLNPRQIIGQIQAELHPDATNICPNCGQMNAKVSAMNCVLNLPSFFELERNNIAEPLKNGSYNSNLA